MAIAQPGPETDLATKRTEREDSTRFIRAPAVETVANRLIDLYHPHLRPCRIAYLFRVSKNGSWRSQGRDVLGKAKTATPEVRHLANDIDAEIVIEQARWEELTDEQQDALVDHELCHLVVATDANGCELCRPDGRPRLTIRGHDVEEFADVIRRHGLWQIDLVTAARAVQLHLPVDHGEAAEAPESPADAPAQWPQEDELAQRRRPPGRQGK